MGIVAGFGLNVVPAIDYERWDEGERCTYTNRN